MGKHSSSLEPWKPSPAQSYAAQLLAHLYTWQRTADEVHCDISTVARWLRIPEFQALIDAHVDAVGRELNRELMLGTLSMARQWRLMSEGEIPANDERFDRIGPIIGKLYDRAIDFDVPHRNDAASAPGMAQQINVYTGQPEQRIPPPTDVTPD